MKTKLINIVVFFAVIFLTLRYAGSSADAIRPFFGYIFFTALFCFLSIKNLGNIKNTEISLFVFILYMFITISWSGSTSYGLSKPLMLILFTFFFIVTQKYFVINFNQVAYFFLISNILFLILFYQTFGNPFEVVITSHTRLKDEETNPITFSRYLGFASFFVIYLFFNKRNLLLKISLGVLFLISLTYMLLSGSKGPVFAFIIAVVVLSLLLNKNLINKIYILIGLAAAFMYGLNKLLLSDLSNFIEKRYVENEGSYDARLNLFTNSLELIERTNIFYFLFGFGSGDYAIFSLGRDIRSYPHNLLIEILFEYGILGLLLFIIFIYNSLKGWRKFSSDKIYSYFLALWVYTGLNSMVSGDIYGNFLFFGMCILLSARGYYINRTPHLKYSLP